MTGSQDKENEGGVSLLYVKLNSFKIQCCVIRIILHMITGEDETHAADDMGRSAMLPLLLPGQGTMI